MSHVNILDASAILAFFHHERGSEIVEAALDDAPCHITTVNYCEVLGKLLDKGVSADAARSSVDSLRLTIIDFDIELALAAADLRSKTNAIGASMADRACLALAQRLHAGRLAVRVYTADQAWTRLKFPFSVHMIRPARQK